MNTRKAYDTAVNSFNDFRILYKIPVTWPIPKEQIIWFISYCFEKMYSPKTITSYISGLSFYHKINGWYNISDLFIIRKLLEGCRRMRPSVDCRAPISIKMLQNLCTLLSSVTFNEYEATLFKALFTTAYFGMFRVGELTVTGSKGCVDVDNVSIRRDGKLVSICLKYTKTNQYGNPIIVRIPCEENDIICPVCNMKNFLAVRPKVQGPLFVHSNMKGVTRYQFAAVLKKCVEKSQFNSHAIKTHSFRIGRATQLAIMGVSDENIMKLGRWTSNAFGSYIRINKHK